jgi:osmotically-inducible protein OsmY
MGTELDLKHKILAELEWEPSIDAAHIGVAVTDSVVTLTGAVASYAEKLTAERATKRITGVRAVANDLEVRPAVPAQRNDTEIARAAVSALQWDIQVPHEKITVRVADGWVTLEGQVPYHYQKVAADGAVRRLTGVRGVSNTIIVKPAIQPGDVKARIEAAFRRSAELDARGIQVDAAGGKVTLRGNVRSWAERDEAERAAWAAPGVAEVDDQVRVAF